MTERRKSNGIFQVIAAVVRECKGLRQNAPSNYCDQTNAALIAAIQKSVRLQRGCAACIYLSATSVLYENRLQGMSHIYFEGKEAG